MKLLVWMASVTTDWSINLEEAEVEGDVVNETTHFLRQFKRDDPTHDVLKNKKKTKWIRIDEVIVEEYERS